MGRRVYGLSQTSTLNCIIGFTDTETVLLDFDDTSFKTVRYWTRRVNHWFRMDGVLILKSSKDHYHVVFNRRVSWSENMKIVAWVTLLSWNQGLNRWFIMQCIKQGSTLRVSSKFEKPSPRIVYSEGNQDNRIQEFLVERKRIKRIISCISRTDFANLS